MILQYCWKLNLDVNNAPDLSRESVRSDYIKNKFIHGNMSHEYYICKLLHKQRTKLTYAIDFLLVKLLSNITCSCDLFVYMKVTVHYLLKDPV